jgi:hypothetical protein
MGKMGTQKERRSGKKNRFPHVFLILTLSFFSVCPSDYCQAKLAGSQSAVEYCTSLSILFQLMTSLFRLYEGLLLLFLFQ